MTHTSQAGSPNRPITGYLALSCDSYVLEGHSNVKHAHEIATMFHHTMRHRLELCDQTGPSENHVLDTTEDAFQYTYSCLALKLWQYKMHSRDIKLCASLNVHRGDFQNERSLEQCSKRARHYRNIATLMHTKQVQAALNRQALIVLI